MIDETNLAMRELEQRVRRATARRRAFFRMLHATDRVLWQLEEMNRDGVGTIPEALRQAIREELAELPADCAAVFRDSGRVQEVLDSIFDVQDCLFAWKDPQRVDDETDELERLAG
jgi:hypothetical protein